MKVDNTVKNGLCVSCGICAAICPTNAIAYKYKNGLYIPVIDKNSCFNCGKCFDACPGKGVNFDRLYFRCSQNPPLNYYFGKYKNCYIAKARDEEVLRSAVSGGVTTELVYRLLDDELYKCAFLVDGYDCCNQIMSKRIIKGMPLKNTTKSRYIPVSQENTIRYILEHNKDKVIIVGTPCFIVGLLQVIAMYNLERSNYFIIGLFCYNILRYNIIDYFQKMVKHDIVEARFRAKKNGEHQEVDIFVDFNGVEYQYPTSLRKKVRTFFSLERCLYCVDKLNQFADISVGDNYTGLFKSDDGSNSVIIRSDIAASIWKKYWKYFDVNEIDFEQIYDSQGMRHRKQNYGASIEKSKRCGFDINEGQLFDASVQFSKIKYFISKKKIALGESYTNSHIWLEMIVNIRSVLFLFVNKIKGH